VNTARQWADSIETTTTLRPVWCCSCGVVFGMPKELYRQRKADGDWFWCPNGHQQHYTEREEDRLRRLLDNAETRARACADQKDAAERSNRALRGVVTRTKRRVADGVCPAGCRRHFSNLERHMATQHPDYAQSPDEEHAP
jgi:hypothetical protein